MRAIFAPLKYVVEAQTSAGESRPLYWDAIAAFDAESIAKRYADACGASGSAELYRVSMKAGFSWVVVHTAGRRAAAVEAGLARNHPQAPAAPKASVSA